MFSPKASGFVQTPTDVDPFREDLLTRHRVKIAQPEKTYGGNRAFGVNNRLSPLRQKNSHQQVA